MKNLVLKNLQLNGKQMLNKNVNNDPKRLNVKPITAIIITRLKYGLSLFRRCISGLLLVRKITPANKATNPIRPVIN